MSDDKVSSSSPNAFPGLKVIRLFFFFMLNSAEHEIFLLINMKMPTIVSIFIFISSENFLQGYA